MTTTLFKYIQSELIQKGLNEFINEEGELVYFNKEYQFIHKIIQYDSDVSAIVEELFTGLKLEDLIYDKEFKRTFTNRFLNRSFNRQTVEEFQSVLTSTFLLNQTYINLIYNNLDRIMKQNAEQSSDTSQTNNQSSDGFTTTDNRQAYADLPQNNVQLDVDSTLMDSASDNTISRNKQSNTQSNTGTTTSKNKNTSNTFQVEAIQKASTLLEEVMNRFDQKCFMQVW